MKNKRKTYYLRVEETNGQFRVAEAVKPIQKNQYAVVYKPVNVRNLARDLKKGKIVSY